MDTAIVTLAVQYGIPIAILVALVPALYNIGTGVVTEVRKFLEKTNEIQGKFYDELVANIKESNLNVTKVVEDLRTQGTNTMMQLNIAKEDGIKNVKEGFETATNAILSKTILEVDNKFLEVEKRIIEIQIDIKTMLEEKIGEIIKSSTDSQLSSTIRDSQLEVAQRRTRKQKSR